jgi:hypothetical protein
LSTLTFPFGPVIRQSKRYGASPPLADPTNRHVTGPVDGATHGVFWTAKDPVNTGMLVVVGTVVVVATVVVVGGVVVVAGTVVVVVVVGPVPSPQAAQATIADAASTVRHKADDVRARRTLNDIMTAYSSKQAAPRS